MFGSEGSGNQKKFWTADNKLVKLNSKYREADKEVSAYELGSLAVDLPQSINVFCYQNVVRRYRLNVARLFLAQRETAQCKTFLMHVHSDVNCGMIIHV